VPGVVTEAKGLLLVDLSSLKLEQTRKQKDVVMVMVV
jgi:hypothetical protein